MFGFFKNTGSSVVQSGNGNISMTGDGNITINGVNYKGKNVSILNNAVIIDGVVQKETVSGVVSVQVTGNIANFTCNAPATIKGDVYGSVDVNGPLECGEIHGDVDANGPVTTNRLDY